MHILLAAHAVYNLHSSDFSFGGSKLFFSGSDRVDEIL